MIDGNPNDGSGYTHSCLRVRGSFCRDSGDRILGFQADFHREIGHSNDTSKGGTGDVVSGM